MRIFDCSLSLLVSLPPGTRYLASFSRFHAIYIHALSLSDAIVITMRCCLLFSHRSHITLAECDANMRGFENHIKHVLLE